MPIVFQRLSYSPESTEHKKNVCSQFRWLQIHCIHTHLAGCKSISLRLAKINKLVLKYNCMHKRMLRKSKCPFIFTSACSESAVHGVILDWLTVALGRGFNNSTLQAGFLAILTDYATPYATVWLFLLCTPILPSAWVRELHIRVARSQYMGSLGKHKNILSSCCSLGCGQLSRVSGTLVMRWCHIVSS